MNVRTRVGAALATGACLVSTSLGASAAADGPSFGPVELVSRDSDGVPGDRGSEDPAVSGNGRYVVYQSNATTLVDKRPTRLRNIFMFDRKTKTTTRILALAKEYGDSPSPDVNGGGRLVVFSTEAALDPGDDNEASDVYLWDRATGQSSLVSRGLDGRSGNASSSKARIAKNGQFITFRSKASNLTPDVDNNGTGDQYIWDRTTGTTQLVSTSRSGSPTGYVDDEGSISADGRFVAYTTNAADALPSGNSRDQVVLWDRSDGSAALVSRTPEGQGGNGTSYEAEISDGGRFVAFTSFADNLSPNVGPRAINIYRYDRLSGDLVLVSRNPDGQPANGNSSGPTMSADGRTIAFASEATDLTSGETRGFNNIFAFHFADGSIDLLSPAARTTSSNSDYRLGSYDPSISQDGKVVTFFSDATDLIPQSRFSDQIYSVSRP